MHLFIHGLSDICIAVLNRRSHVKFACVDGQSAGSLCDLEVAVTWHLHSRLLQAVDVLQQVALSVSAVEF